MHIALTDGQHADFLMLNQMIDDEYYRLYGEIVLEYRRHNKPETLEDVVIIYIDHEPMACGAYRRFGEGTVEIKRVYVREAYRRQGLAQTLMKCLEETAINKGFSKAILETGKEMNAAIALYQSLGYEMIDNFGAFEGDELVVCMQKLL